MAIRRLAKYLRITPKRFGYAGMKDRKAITAQLISIFAMQPERLGNIQAADIEILNPRKAAEGLRLGDLAGNRFSIRIIGKEGDLKEIDRQLNGLFPNYFGSQRFGNARFCNHKIGYLILKGMYEEAVKVYLTETGDEFDQRTVEARKALAETWDFARAFNDFPVYRAHERMLLNHLKDHPNDYINAMRMMPKFTRIIFIHALQSFIFNMEVSERINEGALEPEGSEKRCGIDQYGFLDEDIEGDGPVAVNIIGHDSETTERENKILETLNISKEEFRNRSMPEMTCKGDKRAMLAPYLDFKEEGEWVSFRLGAGCYATSLLREFMKR
jgi:tRNA pseudouridine13 synthase